MPAAIELENVTKSYRTSMGGRSLVALSEVSFAVGPGEVCGFLGPNGAGKTTAINILMGFIEADSGVAAILGHPAGDIEARRKVGFLPENFAFYRYLTAPKLLKFHFNLAGIGEPPAGAIERLIGEVKLTGYEDVRIGKYSRGMMQRVGIAQALVGDPEVLVLDEPTSGLDAASRQDVLHLIGRLKTAGKTILLSSHILPEVESIADRIVVIDHGRVIHNGRLNEMLDTRNRTEMRVAALPDDMEEKLACYGAEVERTATGVTIFVDEGRKRDIAQLLWNSGVEVTSMNPLRKSLEAEFLHLLSTGEDGK
ncbi:MAG TPA: ABC transporter ATP-binding protein [Bryobacteraceae bacterium]|nr:ABC transporter ATP-binding protein [Bryobacteraceae bacterium]